MCYMSQWICLDLLHYSASTWQENIFGDWICERNLKENVLGALFECVEEVLEGDYNLQVVW